MSASQCYIVVGVASHGIVTEQFPLRSLRVTGLRHRSRMYAGPDSRVLKT